MAASIVNLPISLILLVHLHLLEYPLANSPEYDQNLFDPNDRGLRDRTKSMEDMCYFLVAKVEGRKESAKAILPMYPCLTPPDTTAFRTSLAKYLEALRHSVVYSKSTSGSGGAQLRGKGKEVAPEIIEGWWWKNVIVRKSLLEECAGERFERLLLSFSTHALSKCTFGSPSVPINVSLESAADLLHTQPHKYTSLLARSQTTRQEWKRSALLLNQKKANLILLREHISSHAKSAASKYDTLTTDRLLLFTDSKFEELSQEFWVGLKGREALHFIIKLAGLKATDTSSDPVDISPSDNLDATSNKDDLGNIQKASAFLVQPLPIAAAHHPSSLRHMRTSILAPPKKPALTLDSSLDNINAAPQVSKSYAEILLSVPLHTERRMNSALQEALARTKRTSEELREQLNRARETQKAKEEDQGILNLNLWLDDDETQHKLVDLAKKPTAEIFSSAAAYKAPSDSLKTRITHIRDPPIQQPTSEPLSSHLPQPFDGSANLLLTPEPVQDDFEELFTGDRTNDEDGRPSTPHRLITSTPPASVKPRSAYARRVLASQSKQKSNRKGKVVFVVSNAAGLRKSRMSVRMSFALAKRPSLFGPLSDEEDEDNIENGHENEIDQIIDAVHDESTSFENSYMTPKITRLPSPYKSHTVSSFKTLHTTPGPRPSFKIIERQSLASLPDGLTSTDDVLQDPFVLNPSDTDGDWIDEDDMHTTGGREIDEDDGDGCDGKSLTIRDILLRTSDTTQFDLLGADKLDLADASTAWE